MANRRQTLSSAAIRTEKTYLGWVCRFVLHFNGKAPTELGPAEVTAFLEQLALKRNVAASTQNQALNALVFLYDNVLDRPLGELGAFQIYTHALNRGGLAVRSPLDAS